MMTCDDAEILLHALIDGELDAFHAREVEAHVASCPRCAPQLRGYRDLRAQLTAVDLRPAAPSALRARIDAVLPKPARSARNVTSRRSMLKGAAFGAAASALAAASLFVVVVRDDRDARVLDDAISAHLRSLQAEHLTDVATSDQHTVKPWFNGRLDIAPPVIDLTAQGFTLLGGRLDYIDGKAVAALVYKRRKHIINLFVGESLGAAPGAPRAETVHGFNIRRWTDKGLTLLAVSDIAGEELQEFSDKFRAAAASGRA
jgi:anti-sigma factor RsiW